MLIGFLDPEKNKKAKAPKKLLPSNRNISKDIIDKFARHQDSLIEQIKKLDSLNHQKTIITSAVAKFVELISFDSFIP